MVGSDIKNVSFKDGLGLTVKSEEILVTNANSGSKSDVMDLVLNKV